MRKYLIELCGIAVVLSLVSGGTAQLDNKYENDNNAAELLSSFDTIYTNELFSSDYYKDKVLFSFYSRSNLHTPRQLLISNVSSVIHSGFDVARKTLIVIHGYESNLRSAFFQDVKNGALEAHDFNLIGVGWDYFTQNPNYGWVVSETKPVGVYVSLFIEFLISQGLSPSDLHLIGHSLGAHVAGFAGKKLRADGYLAARITGLDPALPGFYNLNDATARLNATDADYVDCIHTCGGILGIPDPICQADFFPNRGQNVQPGCSPFDLGACSHGRSFKYFAESFNSSHIFSSETCTGYLFWVPFNCHDEGAVMGYPAGAQRYRGLFSLTTNTQSPFAKTIKTTPH